MKKSRMNTVLPPVMSDWAKRFIAICLALITAVLFTLPAFAEEPGTTYSSEIVPGGYIWEEKSADLPFEVAIDVAAGNGNVYVLCGDYDTDKEFLCIYSTDAKLQKTISLNCTEDTRYRAVYVSKDGKQYLLRINMVSGVDKSITVLRLDGEKLTEICADVYLDGKYITADFAVSEADTTVVLGSYSYDYKIGSFFRRDGYSVFDTNGDLAAYSNGRRSSTLKRNYEERKIWVYKDFNVKSEDLTEKAFSKDFTAKSYTKEYRSPDLILKNNYDLLGYNYDKPNEVILLMKKDIYDAQFYSWCTVDAQTIADVSYGNKLTVYYNTLKKYPDSKYLRVAYSDSYDLDSLAEDLAFDFNEQNDDYEAIAMPFEEGGEYDILLLDNPEVSENGQTQFLTEADKFTENITGKAALADIYELMGDSINEETTYMNLLRSDEIHGKLYALTPYYELTLPIAYKEYIENNAFKTLDDVISLEKSTKNWLFASYDGNTVFYRLFPFVYIRNADKGITELDTPELRKLLDLGALYKDGTQTEDELELRDSSPLRAQKNEFGGITLADSSVYDFVINDIRNKYYLSTIFDGGSPSSDDLGENNIFTHYSSFKNLYFGGADISFPGVPDMGQAVLTPHYNGLRVCVPEKPSDINAAKAFINWICASDDEMLHCFHIKPSRLSMEATAAAALKTPRTHENSKGETVRDEFYLGLEKITVPDVNEADVNELLSAFEGNVYISKQGDMFVEGAEYYSWVFVDITDSYYKGKISYEELLDKIKDELEHVIY